MKVKISVYVTIDKSLCKCFVIYYTGFTGGLDVVAEREKGGSHSVKEPVKAALLGHRKSSCGEKEG